MNTPHEFARGSSEKGTGRYWRIIKMEETKYLFRRGTFKLCYYSYYLSGTPLLNIEHVHVQSRVLTSFMKTTKESEDISLF